MRRGDTEKCLAHALDDLVADGEVPASLTAPGAAPRLRFRAEEFQLGAAQSDLRQDALFHVTGAGAGPRAIRMGARRALDGGTARYSLGPRSRPVPRSSG